MSYHDPVMREECIQGLNIQPNGTYVDATFGGGGHARAILGELGAAGHLLAFDQDADAQGNIPVLSQPEASPKFTFINSNFRFLQRYLRLHAVQQVDGILADLGVSSHQLNEAERGFSYRFDATLDMRMNQNATLTAQAVINTYSEDELVRVLGQYGEVRNAKTLAKTIIEQRQLRKIKTVQDFIHAIGACVRGKRNRYLAQVFQAIRIEVNDEMGALHSFLEDALKVLKPGGRLVILSYHSLEDRPVKHFLKTGNFEGKQEKDFYGNIYRPFRLITRKAQSPTLEEVKRNPRARSAKLRIAEKQAEQ